LIMRLPSRKRFEKTSLDVVLAVICLGIFIAALDQTVIYGALPGMMADIHLPVTKLDQASWIVIGYLLGYTFAMPLMGRVSDVYGHGRIYIFSLLVFSIGSALVAVSANLQWMVGARILQAIGGGAVVPIAMAIAGDNYSGKNRAVALGVIGAAIEAGGALGPFYGAAIAQYWGWKWIFWINLPVSFIIIGAIFLFLRSNFRIQEKIDYLGGCLFAAGLAFFSLGISQQAGQPHFLILLPFFLAASFLFFALFILRVTRISSPLFRLSMFRSITFSAANLTNLFVGAALIIAMVNVPLMSDTILGQSPLEGGLRLLRLTVMLSIGAVAGGFLTRRFGYRLPTILGLVFSSIGFSFMSHWTLNIADPQMTIHLIICGFGFGLVIAPLGTAVIDSAKEEQKGIASSLVVMMRMVGMIIGLSAITSWGMDRFHLMTAGLSLTEIIAAPEKLTHSLLILFNNFFLASVGICLGAIIPALWLGRKKQKPDMT
jgi:EmrB/QacA subfamily drug resistance transporter